MEFGKEYIKLFETEAEYLAFKASSGYNEPNVSYISGDYAVHYNSLPLINGHMYVEIDGLKWATMNIGANSVTDAGLYFQWGDTQGCTASDVGRNKEFYWTTYKYWTGNTGSGSSGVTKYNSTDGKTILEASDDAATANWGSSWRIPTKDDFAALSAVCSTAWTTTYEGSASGMLLTVTADTADNGKQLFFPAAGSCSNSSLGGVGTNCCYWTSTLCDSTNHAFDTLLRSSGSYWSLDDYRYYGNTIRPVSN